MRKSQELLKSQLLKKQRRTATLKCHSKRSVFVTARRVSTIYGMLLFMCVKTCVLTTFTLLVQSVSSRVQSSRRPTSLIAGNCSAYHGAYYNSLCLKNTQRRRDFKGGVAFGVAKNFCSGLARRL